jgi:hypothetical protein
MGTGFGFQTQIDKDLVIFCKKAISQPKSIQNRGLRNIKILKVLLFRLFNNFLAKILFLKTSNSHFLIATFYKKIKIGPNNNMVP